VGGGWFNLVDCVFEVIKSKYPDRGWATFGNLQVVGNGSQKYPDCGSYKHLKGCLNLNLHDFVTLDGKDYRGKVYVRLVHKCCGNWSCTICYKGVAAREAHNVEKRVAEYVRRHGGVPEHLIISVPRSDWGLDFEVLRRKMEKVAESCGVRGGADIFHHARYANAVEAREKGVPFGWRLGFHWHIIGILKGGYRCRDCKKCSCSGCSGYNELWEKEREKSGWVIKIAMDKEGNVGKRVSIFRTAYYQLEHSSIRKDVTRPHPLTWFGELSYHRLKVKVEKHKHTCPICGSELVKLIYLGKELLVRDKSAFGYKAELFTDLYDSDGSVRFAEVDSGRYAGERFG
jgi:hypothetical protein